MSCHAEFNDRRQTKACVLRHNQVNRPGSSAAAKKKRFSVEHRAVVSGRAPRSVNLRTGWKFNTDQASRTARTGSPARAECGNELRPRPGSVLSHGRTGLSMLPQRKKRLGNRPDGQCPCEGSDCRRADQTEPPIRFYSYEYANPTYGDPLSTFGLAPGAAFGGISFEVEPL
jgi:hypothetical protein